MSESPVVEPISKSDRMELRRIVKARFEVLRERIGHRGHEITLMVRKAMQAESKEDIKQAENESKALIKECQALAKKVAALGTKMNNKGIVPHTRWHDEKAIDGMNSFINTHLRDWRISDLDERVSAKVEEIKSEQGAANLNLRADELGLLQELSIDAIQTEQAKKFLGKIPEVDDILPLPSPKEVKALVA